MLRLVSLALAATIFAGSAFAQSSPPAPKSTSPWLTDQGTDSGMSALAQQPGDDQNQPGPSPLLVVGGMVGVTTLMGVLIANSQNNNNGRPVSP
jgi:hypothetical protein